MPDLHNTVDRSGEQGESRDAIERTDSMTDAAESRQVRRISRAVSHRRARSQSRAVHAVPKCAVRRGDGTRAGEQRQREQG